MSTRYAGSHKNPQGPGDARPTALQVIQDEGVQGKWTDKNIFISGVSAGLGIETAKAIFTTGATLYLAARNLDKARAALGELSKSPRVHLLELDLASLASVRACAKEFLSLTSQLNIFIANAGVMGTPEGRTKDGFETQFGTNHVGHFLLFILLRPALLAAAASSGTDSRAVFVSSLGHRSSEVVLDNYNLEGEYEKWKSYGQSKTANIWTANHVDRLYASQGLRAFSVHPGPIVTPLLQFLSDEEANWLVTHPELAPQFKSPEQGAATTIWGAVSASLNGLGGTYLENVQVAKKYVESEGGYAPGYAEHAYSPEKEARLWELSLKLVNEDA